jgi:hypothetical protein
MAVGWKVEGGASRLLLQLAGVLLLVAATATAGDAAEEVVATVGENILRGSRAYCELKCQHHRDPVNKKRCVDFCIRWQLVLDAIKEGDGATDTLTISEATLHGSRAYCELKCQHHRDPVNKKRCVDFCIKWQLAFDAVKEEDGVTITTGEDILHGSRAYCELKCQHHRDPVNKKRCVDFCIRWQLALDKVKEDGVITVEKDGVTITNGEDILHGSRAYCELKCQHHRDPVNKKRCVDFCIRWQLALGNVKEEDAAAAAEEDGVTITIGEDILHGSRAYCELKCQHHRDPVNKKRCVDFCIKWQLTLGNIKEEDVAAAAAAGNKAVDGTGKEDVRATVATVGGAFRQVV